MRCKISNTLQPGRIKVFNNKFMHGVITTAKCFGGDETSGINIRQQKESLQYERMLHCACNLCMSASLCVCV